MKQIGDKRYSRHKTPTKIRCPTRAGEPAAGSEQVHQIELEMQNEDLARMRDQLGQNLERYVDLYDFAPVGYFL